MNIDSLIRSVDKSVSDYGRYWGMVGPPMAYFEMPVMKAPEGENSVLRLTYVTIAFGMAGEPTEHVEHQLCEAMLQHLMKIGAQMPKPELLFWRMPSKFLLVRNVADDGAISSHLRTRIVIPGVKLVETRALLDVHAS